MSLNRSEKEAVISEVTSLAAKAQTLVIAEYRGITVADMTKLRVEARSKGVNLSVLKNTLARRAVAGSAFDVVADQMTGPLIYGFSEDAVATTKVVADFAKTNDKLVIRGGAFGGFFSLTRKLSMIPVLGLLSCLYLMTQLGVTNWLRFAVWLLFGFSIYFGYGYVNSHLGEDGDGVRKLNNYLRLAMVGFLVSGLGLAGTAFTFVADFVLYFIPSMSADSVLNLEIGLFIVGLVAGEAGVLLQSKEQTVVDT